MANPNFRQTLQNFSKPESIELLKKTIPGLSEDQIALSMLQDWELLLHLADPKVIQLLVEKHPSVVDAVSQMMNSISETAIPDLSQRRRSNSAGWLARSLGADLEDESMDQDPPQQASASQSRPPAPFGGITPAQLAAALNFAQNNIRRTFNRSSSFHIRYFNDGKISFFHTQNQCRLQPHSPLFQHNPPYAILNRNQLHYLKPELTQPETLAIMA